MSEFNLWANQHVKITKSVIVFAHHLCYTVEKRMYENKEERYVLSGDHTCGLPGRL